MSFGYVEFHALFNLPFLLADVDSLTLNGIFSSFSVGKFCLKDWNPNYSSNTILGDLSLKAKHIAKGIEIN